MNKLTWKILYWHNRALTMMLSAIAFQIKQDEYEPIDNLLADCEKELSENRP